MMPLFDFFSNQLQLIKGLHFLHLTLDGISFLEKLNESLIRKDSVHFSLVNMLLGVSLGVNHERSLILYPVVK